MLRGLGAVQGAQAAKKHHSWLVKKIKDKLVRSSLHTVRILHVLASEIIVVSVDSVAGQQSITGSAQSFLEFIPECVPHLCKPLLNFGSGIAELGRHILLVEQKESLCSAYASAYVATHRSSGQVSCMQTVLAMLMFSSPKYIRHVVFLSGFM